MKTFTLYVSLIAAAVGIQHALIKLSHDADAPILAIAQAQARQPFGWQPSAAQLAAIQANYNTTTAADEAALARAERGTP